MFKPKSKIMNRLKMFPKVAANRSEGSTEAASEKASLKASLFETGKDYLKNTSIKGISKAAKTKSWFLMTIWILGTVAGLGCAVFLVFTLTSAYFEYETVIKITKCTECDPEFPDITVCNLNNLGLLEEIPGLQSYPDYISEIEDLFYNNHRQNISDFSEEAQERLWSLYSTSAYYDNVDNGVIAWYLETPAGKNSFVHDCKW